MKTSRPQDPMGARFSSVATMQWEHKHAIVPEGSDVQPYASGGWELVTVIPHQGQPGAVIAYFKRPAVAAAVPRETVVQSSAQTPSEAGS